MMVSCEGEGGIGEGKELAVGHDSGTAAGVRGARRLKGVSHAPVEAIHIAVGKRALVRGHLPHQCGEGEDLGLMRVRL